METTEYTIAKPYIEKISTPHPVFVDVGCGFEEHNNTLPLLGLYWGKYKWRGVMYDRSVMATNFMNKKSPDIVAFEKEIMPTGPDSLFNSLGRIGVSKINFLDIDVDGYDIYIWGEYCKRTAGTNQPEIVIIESNRCLEKEHEKHDGVFVQGSSRAALNKIAEKYDYEEIGYTGNCIFVKKELV